jgi:hypothetical protein
VGGKPCSLELVWVDVGRRCSKGLVRSCVRVLGAWALSLHVGVAVLGGKGSVVAYDGGVVQVSGPANV